MLIFVALMYFCLACTTIWLVFFPTGRDVVVQFIVAAGARLARRRLRWRRAQAHRLGEALARLDRAARRQCALARRHRRMFALAALVVVAPALVALLLSKPDMLPGYEAAETLPDPRTTKSMLTSERPALWCFSCMMHGTRLR